jgi:hypothetical protein
VALAASLALRRLMVKSVCKPELFQDKGEMYGQRKRHKERREKETYPNSDGEAGR